MPNIKFLTLQTSLKSDI